MQIGRDRAFAVFLVAAVVPVSAVQAKEPVCEPWSYDSNGGFEGGEHVASTSCWTVDPQQMHALSLSCTSALRLESDDPAPPESDGEVETTYAFDGGETFVVLSRLEEADFAWAHYFSATDPETGTAMVKALKSARHVDVSLEGGSTKTRILLTGSRAAIEAMEAGCQ
jgi:hypothetical protein